MIIGSGIDDVVGVRDGAVTLPHLVGGDGILDTFELPFSDDESAQLNRSAGIVRAAIESLSL